MFDKKMRTMDIILVILGIVVVIFIYIMLRIYLLMGSIPDSIVYSFFTVVTGELGFMSLIKQAKTKFREREWELQDKAEEKKEEEKRQQNDQEESNLILKDENHQGK